MLIIRDKQMEMLQAEANRKFVNEVFEAMKSDLPENTIPAEEEPEMIKSGLEGLSVAQSRYDLEDDDSLAVFIRMGWIVSADFHLTPESNAILNDESIHPQLRMSEVVKNHRYIPESETED